MTNPEKAPRVLMVLESGLPTKGGGGAESQVQTLGIEFQRRGIPVSVVTPMVHWAAQKAEDVVAGFPITRIRYPRVKLLGSLWLLIALALLLVRRRGTYDVIHSHIAGNMSAVCCLVGPLLGKPVFVKLTGMTEMRGGILDAHPGWPTRLRKWAMRQATAYQATSSRIGRMLVESGFDASKVALIANAVDIERFRASGGRDERRRALCGERRLVGIYVGRLEWEKGVELMLRGWARVLQSRDDALLLVVGNGSLQPSLERLCELLGISDQVKFLGPTKQPETFLQLADFGLLASLHEGLSNTLLEYMSSGLPVLGSRVSGNEDFIVEGRTGWIFTPGDEDSYVDALRRACDASQEAMATMSAQALAMVQSRASIRHVGDSLIRLYGRGLGEPASQH